MEGNSLSNKEYNLDNYKDLLKKMKVDMLEFNNFVERVKRNEDLNLPKSKEEIEFFKDHIYRDYLRNAEKYRDTKEDRELIKKLENIYNQLKSNSD